MPVIYNKKVEYAYTDPGVKAHTLSWAEYQALSEDDKMNGDLYFIPDKQPEGNPSRIWTKLGTDPLTTQADDVSGAVNELNSSLNTLLPVQKNITLGNGVIYLVKEGRHINASCSATSVSTLTTNTWTRIVNTFDFPKFSFLSINLVNGQTLTLRMDGNRSLDYYLSGTNTNVWLQGAGASVSDN